MKRSLLLTTALTGLVVVSAPLAAHAAITTTKVTTYTYDFPNSTPTSREDVDVDTDCPVQYTGGGGGGGGGSGVDVNGDGVGDYGSQQDARDAGFNNGTNVGNYDNPHGQNPDTCGNCGGGGSSGGGGGCFLTTAVVTATGEADNGPTLSAMRHLRDHYVTGTEEGQKRIEIYYRLAPEIVRRINIRSDANQVWLKLHEDRIAPIKDMVREERWQDADTAYSVMLHHLIGHYLIQDYASLKSDMRRALDDSLVFYAV